MHNKLSIDEIKGILKGIKGPISWVSAKLPWILTWACFIWICNYFLNSFLVKLRHLVNMFRIIYWLLLGFHWSTNQNRISKMKTHLRNDESKFKNETFEQFISKKMSLNHRKIFDRSSPTFEFDCCANRFQLENFFSEIISD